MTLRLVKPTVEEIIEEKEEKIYRLPCPTSTDHISINKVIYEVQNILAYMTKEQRDLGGGLGKTWDVLMMSHFSKTMGILNSYVAQGTHHISKYKLMRLFNAVSVIRCYANMRAKIHPAQTDWINKAFENLHKTCNDIVMHNPGIVNYCAAELEGNKQQKKISFAYKKHFM